MDEVSLNLLRWTIVAGWSLLAPCPGTLLLSIICLSCSGTTQFKTPPQHESPAHPASPIGGGAPIRPRSASISAPRLRTEDDGLTCANLIGSDSIYLPRYRPDCPATSGFTQFGGHCYFVSSSPLSWENARATCKSAGGYLAAIGEEAEWQFLIEHLPEAHIGACKDDANGEWRWVSGESVDWAAWAHGEPNGAQGGEGCAEQYSNGQWNDAGCPSGTELPFVCEFD